MYNSEEEGEISDIDSTVTPIEHPSSLFERHGYFVETDDPSSTDSRIRKCLETRSTCIRHKHKSERKHRKAATDKDIDISHAGVIPTEITEVYQELQTLSAKLKEENRILLDREQQLREREDDLSVSRSNVKTITELQVKQRCETVEQHYLGEISRLENLLRDKYKETRRLKENFNTIKEANDVLKKELETLQVQHTKLEKQSLGLQARLTNLQRKQDYKCHKEPDLGALSLATQSASVGNKGTLTAKTRDIPTKHSTKVPKSVASNYDALIVLLEWVSESHLRPLVTDQPSKPLDKTDQRAHDRCIKVLPSLVDILRDLPHFSSKSYLPCLQFIYWSILHIEQTHSTQKSNLASTLRRLGEELYKPRSVKLGPDDDDDLVGPDLSLGEKTEKLPPLLKSPRIQVRFLASLIIIKTLTQADLLANVFSILRTDLRTEPGKELFLYYQATPIFLPFLRLLNKNFLSSAVDVYLHMSMESAYLSHFLESCSNESWFRTIALVFRAPNLDNKVIEKLSIVLQKLSTIKSNKKYFEVYMILPAVQELLRNCGTESSFLAMNLKSILLNMPANTKGPSP